MVLLNRLKHHLDPYLSKEQVMGIAGFLFYRETKGRSLEEMDPTFSGSLFSMPNIRRNL
jgi:hypothetical protein